VEPFGEAHNATPMWKATTRSFLGVGPVKKQYTEPSNLNGKAGDYFKKFVSEAQSAKVNSKADRFLKHINLKKASKENRRCSYPVRGRIPGGIPGRDQQRFCKPFGNPPNFFAHLTSYKPFSKFFYKVNNQGIIYKYTNIYIK